MPHEHAMPREHVESCRRTVEEARPPDEFFTDVHLSAADLQLLRRGRRDFDGALHDSRRSRARSPF